LAGLVAEGGELFDVPLDLVERFPPDLLDPLALRDVAGDREDGRLPLQGGWSELISTGPGSRLS
jgi:hypothetical protein